MPVRPPGTELGDLPMHWTPDGKYLFYSPHTRVMKVELSNGRVSHSKEVFPGGSATAAARCRGWRRRCQLAGTALFARITAEIDRFIDSWRFNRALKKAENTLVSAVSDPNLSEQNRLQLKIELENLRMLRVREDLGPVKLLANSVSVA